MMRKFHWLIVRGVNVGGSFSKREVYLWWFASQCEPHEKKIETRIHRD